MKSTIIKRWLRSKPNPGWDLQPKGSLETLTSKDIDKLFDDVAEGYLRNDVNALDRTMSKDFRVNYKLESDRKTLEGIGDKWLFLNSLYRGNQHGTKFEYYKIKKKEVLSSSPTHWKVICVVSYKANEYDGNVLKDTIEQLVEIKLENGNPVVANMEYGYADDV